MRRTRIRESLAAGESVSETDRLFLEAAGDGEGDAGREAELQGEEARAKEAAVAAEEAGTNTRMGPERIKVYLEPGRAESAF